MISASPCNNTNNIYNELQPLKDKNVDDFHDHLINTISIFDEKLSKARHLFTTNAENDPVKSDEATGKVQAPTKLDLYTAAVSNVRVVGDKLVVLANVGGKQIAFAEPESPALPPSAADSAHSLVNGYANMSKQATQTSKDINSLLQQMNAILMG